MKKQPHNVDVIVGANIRNRRSLIRMSQSDLGAAVGVTFQQVQKYEKGTNRVSASKLVEIARTLKCTATDLLNGTEAANESTPATPTSREAMHIARLFDELSPQQRFATRKLLEAIVAQETEAMGKEAA